LRSYCPYSPYCLEWVFSEVRIAPVHYRKGALAPYASPPDAKQRIVCMRNTSSKEYCMGLGLSVWCIHCKHGECACAAMRIRVR